jgi:hypothetical protein
VLGLLVVQLLLKMLEIFPIFLQHRLMSRKISIRKLCELSDGRRAVCWTRLLENCKEKTTHINKSESPNDASHLLQLKTEKEECPLGTEQSTKEITIKVNLRMEPKTPFERIDRTTKDLNRTVPVSMPIFNAVQFVREKLGQLRKTDVSHKLHRI